MALPSGADVKIGAYEFMLDPTVEEPYLHAYLSLAPDEQSVAGQPGAKHVEPNILRWSYDDFSGGDGNKFYDPDDPYTYWGGACNPRIIGSVGAVPDYDEQSHTIGANPTRGIFFQNTGGRLWLFADRQAFYSSNYGVSFSAHGANPIQGASDYVVAVAHDSEFPLFATNDGTVRDVWRFTDTTTVETQMVNSVTSSQRFYGMAEMNGNLYGWTGRNLLRYPVTSDGQTQSSSNKVYTPYTEAAFGATAYGGIVPTEDSVVFFTATAGLTTVYMAKHKSHAPLIDYEGFTAKGIAYNQGVIVLVGEEEGRVKLYGISLRSRAPIPLGEVGWHYGATNARCISRGPGTTFLVGADDGTTNYLYQYDLELDAFSVIDTCTIASTGTVGACVASGTKRVFAFTNASTTVKTRAYDDDDTAPTGAFTWDSPAWDFAYPYATKQLLGFNVMNDQGRASGTMTIYYQDDEDGTWTSAGTTSAGSKHTYIDLATSNITFNTLRMRAVGASGARLLSITARVRIVDYQEFWQLTLTLKDEHYRNAPSSRRTQAHVLRDYVHTLITNKQVVTFLDGKRYRKKGGASDGYTTHTVVLESPVDRIGARDDGGIEVTLKAVS